MRCKLEGFKVMIYLFICVWGHICHSVRVEVMVGGDEPALFPISRRFRPLHLRFSLPFHKKDSPLIQAKN